MGRLEEGIDWQRAYRDKGTNKGRNSFTVGGGGSGCVSQLEQTNSRETDSVASNGREAPYCPGCFPAPFIF